MSRPAAKKELGQHFLVDENLLGVIGRLAELAPEDVVLEIGPGLGVLTTFLADRATHVHAVELDRSLEPRLREAIAGRANVELHFGDVPARPAPDRPDFAEPDLAGPRWESYVDRLAPLPAAAAAWRVPDPITDFAAYLPYVVLAEVLTDGDASRLVRRLVLTDRSVTSLDRWRNQISGLNTAKNARTGSATKSAVRSE